MHIDTREYVSRSSAICNDLNFSISWEHLLENVFLDRSTVTQWNLPETTRARYVVRWVRDVGGTASANVGYVSAHGQSFPVAGEAFVQSEKLILHSCWQASAKDPGRMLLARWKYGTSLRRTLTRICPRVRGNISESTQLAGWTVRQGQIQFSVSISLWRFPHRTSPSLLVTGPFFCRDWMHTFVLWQHQTQFPWWYSRLYMLLYQRLHLYSFICAIVQ
jgi:hypothetical protein